MRENIYWVWLSMVFRDSVRHLWELMGLYESAEEACAELISGSNKIRLSDKEKSNIKAYTFGDAERHFEDCASKNIGIAAYSDIDYPNQLRYIADPPAALYYKGNIGCVSGSRTVVSVGTRKASAQSIETCRKICTSLAENGYVIVSGFAVGIDITSHMAAAECGMPTACVLGCGIDVNYPKDNFKYRDTILSSGGVFISEYPPATPAFRGNFPKRNRIMTGIGRAVMVFQAAEASGSLITARLAAEQGRELFVLPPADIFSDTFSGNIKLIREGAVPLMGVNDIFEYFKSGSEIDAAVKADAFDYLKKAKNKHSSVSSFTKKADTRKKTKKSENLNKSENLDKSEKADNSDRSEKPEKPKIAAVPEVDVTAEKAHTEEAVAATSEAPDVSSETMNVLKNEIGAEKNDSEEKEEKNDETSAETVRDGIQKEALELLKNHGKMHADVIGTKLGVDSIEIASELTELELLGYIRAQTGGIYEYVL